MNRKKRNLVLPVQATPEIGKTIEVAPGILWARLALPGRLDHVNIYLIDDGDGWAVFDTGLANDETRAAWDALLAGPLRGRPLTRLIASHFHFDHIGLAGWLIEKSGMPLVTSQTTYLRSINTQLNPDALKQHPAYAAFYREHGLDNQKIGFLTARGGDHMKRVTLLPPIFHRIIAGDTLQIGGRTFNVMTSDGHAPEQVMLYCAGDKFFLAADQVLAKITPSVGVWAVDPDGNPLGHYLRSLESIRSAVDDDALVLAGHQQPFFGLHARLGELRDHHDSRCAMILDACATPHTVAELVPVIFRGVLDDYSFGFAFNEALAHINLMLERNEITWRKARGHARQYVRA